ncbi:ABC-2 type transporter family protein [Striga asiatica]|uniref:ABC-2 type transporter family protein n=1 Tax=Striga asiatica TaxID=4170 RepID=A0A5A7PRC8_STRAF|nr:ABC-2 type transporter family protein [Striga asiatica]
MKTFEKVNVYGKRHVIVITKNGPHRLHGPPIRVPRLKHNAHVHKSPNPIGPEQAKVPGDDGSPVVAHQENPVQAQGIQQAHQVADDVEGGVAGGPRRRVGVAVAAEVGGDGAVAPGG